MSRTSAFWHPFADMSAVAGRELVLTSGEGCVVRDVEGTEYLDATAGLWYCNVGHGRAEIAEAAREQMATLAAYSAFGDVATSVTLDLADRLAGIAPTANAKVFFTSGGSDAVDTAVKLVRRYFEAAGQPDRRIIITRSRAYHGMHLAGTALAGIAANRDGYGALDPDVVAVQWDDSAALAAIIRELGTGRVAGFFCEPVIGAGGVFSAPAGYLNEVRDICARAGVLFIADEVITGYGRTGQWFASDGLEPDIVLTAKGLTSGYLPMGAVLVGAKVAAPFWTSPGLIWRHGYTYSGHAAAAAAAMANLDIIERERLVARVADFALALKAALAPLRDHSWVAQVRSAPGLLAAIGLDPELTAGDPTMIARLLAEIRRRGVLTRSLADGSLQISPPFVVSRDQLRDIAATIDGALTSLGSHRNRRLPADEPLMPEVTQDEIGGHGTSDQRLIADVPPHHGA